MSIKIVTISLALIFITTLGFADIYRGSIKTIDELEQQARVEKALNYGRFY